MGLGYVLFICVSLYLLHVDKKHKNKFKFKHIHYLVETAADTGELITITLLSKTVDAVREKECVSMMQRTMTTSTNNFAIISRALPDDNKGIHKWYTYNKSVTDELLLGYSLQCSKIDVV